MTQPTDKNALEPKFGSNATPELAYFAGKQHERADLIEWLKQGDGFEDIIDLIREGAHEGHRTDD